MPSSSPATGCGKSCFTWRRLAGGESVQVITSDKESLRESVGRSTARELIAAGLGEPFSTGLGRIKKEWATFTPSSADEWVRVSEEARRCARATPLASPHALEAA